MSCNQEGSHRSLPEILLTLRRTETDIVDHGPSSTAILTILKLGNLSLPGEAIEFSSNN